MTCISHESTAFTNGATRPNGLRTLLDALLKRVRKGASGNSNASTQIKQRTSLDARREELKLSIWALGYSGLARDAARLHRELTKLEANA